VPDIIFPVTRRNYDIILYEKIPGQEKRGNFTRPRRNDRVKSTQQEMTKREKEVRIKSAPGYLE